MSPPADAPATFPAQIESARLLFLRPYAFQDSVLGVSPSQAQSTVLDQLHSLFSAPKVARFCGFRAHQDLPTTQAKLQSMIEDWQAGRAFSYLVYRRDDPTQLIGNQHIKPQGSRLNLGCAFAPAHWRQGYALEATRFWCDWGLKQAGIWRVEAFCDADHPASRGVMEQAGMQFEGRLRRFFHQPELDEAPHDVLMYARVRDDQRSEPGNQ